MGCCKSRRRWLEPNIDYDPDFREQQKVEGHTNRCPAGHPMEELVTDKAGYLRCDVCGAAQNVGRRMQGCWDCDYHVCRSCATKFEDSEWYASWRQFWHGNAAAVSPEPVVESSVEEGLVEESHAAVPRCPGKHTMCSYFTAPEPPVQCDVCGKHLAPYVRIWGCSQCDYDIGPCCERKFQEPAFLESWQIFWSIPKEDILKEDDPPLPAPNDPPISSSGSTTAKGSLSNTAEAEAEPEGPKVTRAKPVQLNIQEEDLVQTEAESSKAMVLGGKNEVVAPALLNEVLKKDVPEKSKKETGEGVDPAVLNFARKGHAEAKVVSEETSAKDVSVVPPDEEEDKEEKKSKKKKKEDKEKSEKSEKKEKKSKKEGKESRKTIQGDEDAERQERREQRRLKKSRREGAPAAEDME